MYNEVGRQMQQDRLTDNVTYESPDQQMARLRSMGATNAVPPLEVSPCVKVISKGVDGTIKEEVHEWTEFFASRPDICVNCDEHGNTDPAAWRGRMPSFMKTPPVVERYETCRRSVAPIPQDNLIHPAATAMANAVDTYVPGPVPGAVPPVGLASAILGVGPQYSQEYVEPTTVRAALPIQEIAANPNQNVTNTVQLIFEKHTGDY